MGGGDGSNQTRTLLFFLSILFFANIIVGETVSETGNGAMIVGEVVSPQGPVPYKTILLKRHEGRLLSEVSNTFTDAAGKYKFENLPLNASFILELRHNGTRHFKALTTTSPITHADFNLVGTLTVRVIHVNRTMVDGLPIYLEGPPEIILANKTTDKNGVVSFNHLDLNETYRVSFTFYGVPYSENTRFRDETITKVNFTVYETTTSGEDIKIDLHHIFVKLGEEHLSVLENIIYRNDGVMVFNNSWLKASLPEDSFDLVTSIMDCCLQQFEDVFLFNPMDPIKPGDRFQVRIEYKVKVFSSETLFKERVDYDTDSLYFFFEDLTGVGVKSLNGLTSKGTVTIDDVNYRLLTGSNLEEGSYINVKLSNLSSPQEFGEQVMLGTVLLAIPAGFFFALVLIKNREKTSVEDLESEKLVLFEKISKLESKYDDVISKNAYEKAKSKYKRRVIEIMRQIDHLKDARIEPSIPPSQLLRELCVEERALTSTLEKLKEDFGRGKVSEAAYEKVKARFEGRMLAVKKRIRKLEKLEKSKSERLE